MGSYLYLVSSLPALSPDQAPPLSPEEFRFHCQGVLSAEDLADLDAVLSGRPGEGRSAFCKDWAAADTQIRNSVAKARGARLGVESKPFLKSHAGYRVWLDKEVTDALAKTNPLACEIALDAARWKVLDDLARADAQGLPAVLAFAAKLRLASRWGNMKEEAGRARLDALVEQLESDAAKSGATDFK
jgi:hypothetical protein